MRLRTKFPQIYELEHPKDGRQYFLVSARRQKWGLNERRTFKTKGLAEKFAKVIEEQIIKFGAQVDVPKEKVVLAERFQGLTEKLGAYGRTPEDAVTHYLQHLGTEVAKQEKPFIRGLADEWEEFKSADQTVSKRYLKEIHSYAVFIKRKWGNLRPDELKKNEIELLLKGLKVTNNTRRKYVRYVRMFFSWIKDEGHIAKNPTDGIFFKPDDFNGAFYTPDETTRLLRHVVRHHPDLIGYYALLTFAGLRPSEGGRVQWCDYSFKTSELYVRKGKTNARHIILESSAVAWMKFHHENSSKDAPFVELKNLANREKVIRKAVFNGEWIQDGLRHGFGTYFKALTQSIEKVADYMGNSPDIVKRHYARTIAKDDWESFWNLTPQNVMAEKPALNVSDVGIRCASEPKIKILPQRSALCA
jgi:integrase